MKPEEFLETAGDLLRTGKREADFRSCVSRAYYALYQLIATAVLQHVPLALLSSSGLGGKARISHERLSETLKKSTHASLSRFGSHLENLRHARIEADYKLNVVMSKMHATRSYENAAQLKDEITAFGVAQFAQTLKSELEKYLAAEFSHVTKRSGKRP